MITNRRNVLTSIGVMALSTLGTKAQKITKKSTLRVSLKGNINHSVCRWCYESIEFERLCKAAKEMGIKSIELTGPEEWPILKKYGLTSAMPWGAGLGIDKGFNNLTYHDELIKSYTEIMPKLVEAGLDKIICFSGNKNGISSQLGLENCTIGLKKLMPVCEKYGITLVMELLNSKVDHADYQCDNTAWGVQLCKAVGSSKFKLLYDIYHMQIMEGDIIRTIKNNIQYIAHFHTGGNPGRAEIDETQEIYYPAIMKALLEVNYKGFVGQEFIPKSKNPLESLKKAVLTCDV